MFTSNRMILISVLLFGILVSSLFGATVITQKNGEVVSGEIIEHVLFERIVLRTTDGGLKIIPSRDIAEIEYGVLVESEPIETSEPKETKENIELNMKGIEEPIASEPVKEIQIPSIVVPPETSSEHPTAPLASTTYSFGAPTFDYQGNKYRMSPSRMEALFSRMAYQVPDISPRLISEMEDSVALMKKGNGNSWLAVGLMFLSTVGLANGIENDEGDAIGLSVAGFVTSYILLLRGAFQSSEGRSQGISCVDAYNFLYANKASHY